MDGSGILFDRFVRLLPEGAEASVANYPEHAYLNYEELADHVRKAIPLDKPYVIVAESYSGPVATLLAARPAGNLQAVVFVSSFVSLPLGRTGSWIAGFVPTAVFRVRASTWVLRWLLMDSGAPPDLLSSLQDAIARVRPEVLAERLRGALRADYASVLSGCTVRVVCLAPDADRLLGTRGLRSILAAKPDVEVVKLAGSHLLLQCAPDCAVAALRELRILRA